jgi:hypothetical protein
MVTDDTCNVALLITFPQGPVIALFKESSTRGKRTLVGHVPHPWRCLYRNIDRYLFVVALLVDSKDLEGREDFDVIILLLEKTTNHL